MTDVLDVPRATTAPFWTAFPAEVLSRVDWRNHVHAHKGVMSLFSADLSGKRDARSQARILYRLDVQPDGRLLVLVQSETMPETVPLSARTMRLSDGAWQAPAGTPVSFRLAVAPVARRKDPQNPRRDIIRIVREEQMHDWLAPRLSMALTDVQILNDARAETRTTRTSGKGVPPRLEIATVDATAVVVDAGALARLRLDGVGRYKAYGAGLLTVRPIG